jgi:hypothetical protein
VQELIIQFLEANKFLYHPDFFVEKEYLIFANKQNQ